LDFAKSLKKKKIVEMLEAAVAKGGKTASKGDKGAKAKPAKVPSASTSWDHLESCLQKSHPKVFQTLARPATARQVSELIVAVKIRITKEVQEFFHRHNGQTGGPELIELDGEQYGFRLLSTEQAAREWSVWKELNDGGDFADAEAAADDTVRETWWHDKWLPMAGNGAGDFLCFDFSPAHGGKQGQIITLWHERPNREVAFESVRHVLAELAAVWEAKLP
ncbi:MAG TPA: SMI1/KNR4 family protein, partial [Pirellulaceae bacterium]|nr:SMI1/KNR4 family protein [Pirellulaceae bacterium]